MKLSELILHTQMMQELCQRKGIDIGSIEVFFVSDVLWRSGEVSDDSSLWKNKRPITSTEMNALNGRELLLYDATSWDQYQRARGPK